jgi:hypothetical protein
MTQTEVDELRREIAELRGEVQRLQKPKPYYFPGDDNDPYAIFRPQGVQRSFVGGPFNGEKRVFYERDSRLHLRDGTYELALDGLMHWTSREK